MIPTFVFPGFSKVLGGRETLGSFMWVLTRASEGSYRVLGWLYGGSGRSWGSWADLGGPQGDLGRSWDGLGTLLGVSSCNLGPPGLRWRASGRGTGGPGRCRAENNSCPERYGVSTS